MVEALLALERIYSAKGWLDKSLALLHKVTLIAPQDPTSLYRMSAIYKKQGKPELAQESMERFQKLKASESPR